MTKAGGNVEALAQPASGRFIMSPPVTLDARQDRSESRKANRRQVGRLAAYFAAPLWALQMVIWLVAPKVQETTAPFTITNPLLFALFWLSIAGAVAFSAASAMDVPRTIQGLKSRLSWWARVLAAIALCLASAATISIAVALIPAVQGAAIGIMTNMLNGALVILALSLSLSAFVSWRVNRAARSTNILPTALAAATIAMIVAIFASGAHSMVGLYFAVAVAGLNGIVWFLWGRASSVDGRR
jgi:membrane-associated HD superfamily phosphohydrolase